MTDRDWEARWRQKAEEEIPPPDPWLTAQLPALAPARGNALDLACGRGRNSLPLAAAGFRVLAIDVAETALRLLQEEARRRALQVDILQHDLAAGLPPIPFPIDLVLCFYFLQRDLIPHIRQLIRPGGYFMARSFCQSDASTPAEEIIYGAGELRTLFSDWEILAYDEGNAVSARGGTLAGILARKPQAST